jgi:hypothetical protein
MGNISSSTKVTKGQNYDIMGESNRSVPQIGLGWCLEPNVTGFMMVVYGCLFIFFNHQTSLGTTGLSPGCYFRIAYGEQQDIV